MTWNESLHPRDPRDGQFSSRQVYVILNRTAVVVQEAFGG